MNALNENDTTFADFTHMRVKHYNHTQRVLAGNMTFFVDVGHEYEVDAKLFKNNGNQYQQTPFKFKKMGFCDAANGTNFFQEMRENSNVPANGVCPWPKGTYEIYGLSFNISRYPPYFEGKFMVKTSYYQNDVVLNGYQVYFTIIKT